MTENRPTELYGLDTESRQMVVNVVRQLRKRLLTKEKVLEFDEKEFFPEKEIRQMLGPDIGLQLMFIPEAYGGMGGGARDCCAVTREMCKICLGVGTAFFAIQLGADPLMVGGTEEQKAKWLGAIAEGNTLVAYAVTEPGAGSNLAALKTKAEPVCNDDGSIQGYQINGAKQFISTGGYADYVTILANTPEGPSFFVLEKGTKGFHQGKGEIKHGIRASNTSALTVEDAFVPVENLIGGVPGQGLKQANKVFGYTRLMVGAMALGAGEAALEIAIPYAKERVQFGTPLAEKQGYTHKLIVPHVVRLKAAATHIDEVTHRIDGGELDLQVEGSIAKYFASESANNAADDAMQALGGYGYICEYEVEKIKRDVKITCIYEGTSEIQQNIISTFRWKTTRKTKGGYYQTIAANLGKLAETVPDCGLVVFEEAVRLVNRLIDEMHTRRLTRRQHLMFLLADMITHVEVGAALAKRAATDGNQDGLKCAARIFSHETAKLVADGVRQIVLGSGGFSTDEAASLMTGPMFSAYNDSCQNLMADMDTMAAIIFKDGFTF